MAQVLKRHLSDFENTSERYRQAIRTSIAPSFNIYEIRIWRVLESRRTNFEKLYHEKTERILDSYRNIAGQVSNRHWTLQNKHDSPSDTNVDQLFDKD